MMRQTQWVISSFLASWICIAYFVTRSDASALLNSPEIDESALSESGLISNEEVREALQKLNKEGIRDPKCKLVAILTILAL
jgi:hypothetical protein